MMRPLRRLLVVLCLLALAGAACVAVYDFAVIRPAAASARSLLASAAPEDRNPPALIRDLVAAAHATGQSYQQRAALLAYWRLVAPRERPAIRLLREALWLQLLPHHLTPSEQMGLYVALSYNGHGYGLSQLSRLRYAKAVNQLSAAQAAEAVALLWAPTYLESHPDRLAARRDKLLAAVQHEP